MPDEECNLVAFTEDQKNTHAQGGTKGDESDENDDDPRGGQRVACQQ